MVGEKIPCKFCKNPYSPFNVGKHEIGCAMNPINGGQSIQTNIEDPEPLKSSFTKIRNIIILPNSGLAAHIVREGSDEQSIVPIDFVGTMIVGENEQPTLLVVDGYGLLIPPSMIPGFVGIYKYESDSTVISTDSADSIEDPEPEPEPEKLTSANTTDQILGRIQEAKSVP